MQLTITDKPTGKNIFDDNDKHLSEIAELKNHD